MRPFDPSVVVAWPMGTPLNADARMVEPPGSQNSRPFAIIKAPDRFSRPDLREIWRYRDLFYFLVRRDLLVRYEQTVLGAAWAILQPLATMVLFTIVFGLLTRMPSDQVPYPLFYYSGLLLWTYFSQAVTHSANSLVLNEQLVTKIYFPRILMPMAPVVASLLDLLIGAVLLLLLAAYFEIRPSLHIWVAPLTVLIVAAATLGAGLWLSALNVRYRDVRHVISFLVQFWMFASPVFYPASVIPEKLRLVYSLNPMVGPIEGFRWAVFGTPIDPWPMLMMSSISAIIIVVSGAIYFQSAERSFADLI